MAQNEQERNITSPEDPSHKEDPPPPPQRTGGGERGEGGARRGREKRLDEPGGGHGPSDRLAAVAWLRDGEGRAAYAGARPPGSVRLPGAGADGGRSGQRAGRAVRPPAGAWRRRRDGGAQRRPGRKA